MNSVQIYNTAENMETLLAAAENCTMQENGGKAVISADIPAEKLYDVEAAGRFFQIAGMSSLSEVYFKGTGDVPVTFVLDKKTGAPISYEIDLAQALEKVTNNVLSELSSDNESSGITVQTYRISSELTQLGNVKAGEIPDEVKSSAINYETTKTRFAWRRAGFSLISVDFMGNRAFILYDIHVIIKFSLFFEHGGEGAVA